nr:hypothetical protein [uncultured Methanoregula sp.]
MVFTPAQEKPVPSLHAGKDGESGVLPMSGDVLLQDCRGFTYRSVRICELERFSVK